jgi:(p)ppGpp synthase/HD superfamily hydrolase
MNLQRAIEIAVEAHRDQVDKAGAPYILHPLRG